MCVSMCARERQCMSCMCKTFFTANKCMHCKCVSKCVYVCVCTTFYALS